MKHTIENAILWGCLLVIIAFIVLMLMMGGCASKSAKAMDVLCIGAGGEVFHAQGVGADVAGFKDAEWDMRNCDVNVNKRMGSKRQ